NHGSRCGPISPANWPGMTRPVLWTSLSGSTTAGGRLLCGRVTAPATAARLGQSVGGGLVGVKFGGAGVRPGRMVRWPPEGGVVVGRVRQRRDQRPAVAAAGELRQVLADVDAGRGGGDGLELAADVVGGVGLGVEAVVLGQAAGEEDVDDGAGRGLFGGGRL